MAPPLHPERCGHPITGDPQRPCVLRKDHKAKSHLDHAGLERQRKSQNDWRKNHRNTAEEYRRRQTSRRQVTSMLDQVKAERGCAECGFDDPRALDFDHVNPLSKQHQIADLAGSAPIDLNARYMQRLMNELEKCTVLCANHHRIKTYEARQKGLRG